MDNSQDIDDETRALILRLEREQFLLGQEEANDAAVAASSTLEELEALNAETSTTRSIEDMEAHEEASDSNNSTAETVFQPENLPKSQLNTEDQLTHNRDHNLDPDPVTEHVDHGNTGNRQSMNVDDINDSTSDRIIPHSPTLSDTNPDRQQEEDLLDIPLIECTVCRSAQSCFEIIEVPCGHQYCRGCTQDLFERSLTDDSLFPPRCCRQPITPESVSVFLSSEQKERFAAKLVEINTPDRTYCSNQPCSAFLPPSLNHLDVATCPSCDTDTCVICKARAHPTRAECPADPALQSVLDLATAQGWRRCTSCRALIELGPGCNHITCRCGAEFCYLCGARWKSCPCPQWDGENLAERAARIMDRLAAGRENRERRLQGVVDDLVARHDCARHNWLFRQGAATCEECRRDMPAFVYECVECGLLACRRCCLNRLGGLEDD